jgi:hypothetical protein
MSKSKIVIPRDVLLVEIERRCRQPDCHARMRIGLTKEEARAYSGFECERCERWNNDALSERDVPDGWEELAITGLHTLRGDRRESCEEPSEVVTRMSDQYRKARSNEGMRDETD